MRLKHFALGSTFCLFALACASMRADTLTLENAGPTETINNPDGSGTVNASIYPYNFSINGSSVYTPLMCINLNESVTVGETWTASATTLTLQSNQAYLEDAWIFSQMSATNPQTHQLLYTTSEIQFAVWDVLDNASASTDSELDSAAKSLVSQALTEATTSGDLTDSFLSQFTIYAPTSTPSGYTTPQSYIGETPASVTPEPSSLLLLGTGLIGASTLIMRRRTKGLVSEL